MGHLQDQEVIWPSINNNLHPDFWWIECLSTFEYMYISIEKIKLNLKSIPLSIVAITHQFDDFCLSRFRINSIPNILMHEFDRI